uniref:Putative structural protein n=1 Tax=viral metagenome TaxID=1070528 RepID=A0A6M3LB19_9ZZZZ
MANTDRPRGFHPVGPILHTGMYYLPSTDATAMYRGDLVDLAGSGSAAGVHNWPGVPTVIKSTLTDGYYSVGAILGFVPADGSNTPNLNITYRPASTAMFCIVADHPDQVFEAQDDGGAALDQDAIGLNAMPINTHSGSTATGLSGQEIDAGTTDAPAADASNLLILLGKVNRPNNAFGVNMDWLCKINLHRYRASGDGDAMLGV